MKIIDAANSSINRVMKFYEQQGVGLSYRPTVSYVDGFAKLKDAAALARGEKDFLIKVDRFRVKHLSGIIFRELCGLNVSAEALEEFFNKINERHYEVSKKHSTDITLYKPIRGVLSLYQNLDVIMAHELWHLKEYKTGVLKTTPFLYEGTPAYAMLLFDGQRVKGTIDDARDIYHLFSIGGAYLLENMLPPVPNQFPLMLDPGYRGPVHAELVRFANNKATELSRKTLKDQSYRKMLAASSQEIPEFKAIVGKLSHKNIIEAYRKVGAVKLSEELDKLELGKLIKWFRYGGF